MIDPADFAWARPEPLTRESLEELIAWVDCQPPVEHWLELLGMIEAFEAIANGEF